MSQVHELADDSLYTLNLGSGLRSFGDLTIDIDRAAKAAITGDALHLPLRDGSFEQVVFSDVIEHLPRGTEPQALREISRVLKDKGTLVLSTPNDRMPYTLLDPAHHFSGHRHYRLDDLLSMLRSCGFEVVVKLTKGGMAFLEV